MLDEKLDIYNYAASLEARLSFLEKENAALKNKTARYEEILGGIAAAIVVQNTSGHISQVNSGFIEMMGKTAGYWQDKPACQALPFLPAPPLSQPVVCYCSYEGRLLQVVTVPLGHKAASSQELASVSIIHDMSEQARVNRAKDNFLNLISHELRTPLTSVKGALEILDDHASGELNTLQREFLKMAQHNTERLSSLLQTSFDIVQVETGHLRLLLESILLEQVVEKALIGGLDEMFRQRKVRLEIDFARAPRVYGDILRLSQIFEALLSNACKFTPGGGSVEISSQPHGPDKVRLQVKDSGIGISLFDRSYIFDKFSRADHSSTRQSSGTGLGLSLVKSLVELHGSVLELESEPGQGTTFSFVLPVSH